MVRTITEVAHRDKGDKRDVIPDKRIHRDS
jgi:hypothetical protein